MGEKSSLLQLPNSDAIVDVSIIDSTAWISRIPGDMCQEPNYPGWEYMAGPSYSFLIIHQSTNTKLLFDLGLRKDWVTGVSPKLHEILKPYDLKVEVEKDVPQILQENGVALESIQYLVPSHHHWDHMGDPSQFPAEAELVVGPGFKKAYMPGYPKDPDTYNTTSDAFEGRTVREITFDDNDPRTCTLGGFRAHDWFGDGSFYILDSPGHTIGHISALARTTPGAQGQESTFLFMGGDITHHASTFRPTRVRPIPKSIIPDPRQKPFAAVTSACPGELFAKLHKDRNDTDGEGKSRTTPFCRIVNDHDDEVSRDTCSKLEKFDELDNVLTIIAHDPDVYEVVGNDFFPKTANDWKEKGWKGESHWRFLATLAPS